MASHTRGTPLAQQKEHLDLCEDPKKDSVRILKDKLKQINEKLNKDPDNKKLQEIKLNLEQTFKREQERGFC